MLLPEMSPAELDRACGTQPRWACEQVGNLTGSEGLAKAVDFLVARPLKIALILVGAWLVNRVVRRGIRRFVSRLRGVGAVPPNRSVQRAATIGTVLRSVAGAAIYGMALLTALGELDINLAPLLAGAGVAGVALGFGAQSLVKDFLSGVFMLIEDQYGVGDVIELDSGVSGKVEAITLRVTRFRDVYGTVWHVPNGEIRRVGNKSQNWSRAVVDIALGYGADVARARAIILDAARELAGDDEWSDKFLEPPEVLGVESVRAEGVMVRLVAKVQPLAQWDVERELRERVKATLDAAGVPGPPMPGVVTPPPG